MEAAQPPWQMKAQLCILNFSFRKKRATGKKYKTLPNFQHAQIQIECIYLKVLHKGDIGRDLFQDRLTSLRSNCQIIPKWQSICAYCHSPALNEHTSFELTLKINFKTLPSTNNTIHSNSTTFMPNCLNLSAFFFFPF